MNLLQRLNELNFTKIVFFVYALLIIITAFTSVGFHQPDEFYQIFDFCYFLMGDFPQENKLAWEYFAQIRPTIQVWLAYVFTKPFSLICIDPFHQMIFFRLLSGILSLITFYQGFKYLKKTTSATSVVLAAVFGFWFFPYISVRFSSETWSGCLFFLGLFYFLNTGEKNTKTFLYTGLLHGLSFLFRFQSGFAIMGFFIWLFFIHTSSSKIKELSGYVLLILTCMIFCVILDSFFYDSLVFTPWNYFVENIIHDKASGFGVEPVYFYFESILIKSFLPIGLTIIVSFILFLLKKYKHPISFVFVFFIFFHTLVPHKEERFLFPLIYGLPVIIAFLIESIKLHQKKIILSVFILFNISLGIVVLFRVSRIEVFILKEYSKHNVKSIFVTV